MTLGALQPFARMLVAALLVVLAVTPTPPAFANGPGDAGIARSDVVKLNPASSHDACKLELSTPASVQYRGARSRGYSPDDPSHRELLQITVRHRGASCAYRLEARSLQAVSQPEMQGATTNLTYKLSAQNASAQRGPNGVQIQGYFGPGADTHVYLLEASIDPGQRVPAGVYDDALVVEVFENADAAPVRSNMLRLNVVVPASVDLSVGENPYAGVHTATVDFGHLRRGVRRESTFAFTSNAPVALTLASENDGALRHAQSNARIPFSAKIDGQVVNFTGKVILAATGDPTVVLRKTLDLEITDLPLRAPAGDYADRLTLTITPE